MRRILCFVLLPAAVKMTGLLPFQSSDVASLVPVDALTVEVSQNQVVLRGGDCQGCGEDWEAALAAGADTYITGTMSYNTLLDAKAAGLNVIAAGHYYTEAPVMEAVAKTVSAQFDGVEAVVSECPCEILTV